MFSWEALNSPILGKAVKTMYLGNKKTVSLDEPWLPGQPWMTFHKWLGDLLLWREKQKSAHLAHPCHRLVELWWTELVPSLLRQPFQPWVPAELDPSAPKASSSSTEQLHILRASGWLKWYLCRWYKEICIFQKDVFIYFRREGGVEREGGRILSRFRTECGASCGDWSHDPEITTWDETESWMLKRLYHAGAPGVCIKQEIPPGDSNG